MTRPSNWMLPSGVPPRTVVEIEVVDRQRLLIDGIVDGARIDAEHGRAVVVHEMPADRVGAIGDAPLGRSAAAAPPNLTAPAAEHDELRADRRALAAALTASTPSIALPSGSRSGARRARRSRSSTLAMRSAAARPQVSASILPVRVSGKASHGVGARFKPGLDIDAERQREGTQADARHPRARPRRSPARRAPAGRDRAPNARGSVGSSPGAPRTR